MNLEEFFKQYNKVAIAFSGGVDSAYLLYCATRYNVDVTAYYVKSQFQPQFEYDDAVRLANQLGARLKIINLDVLSYDEVRRNDDLRCYYCKKRIFSAIKNAALSDGYNIILDGTNASDDASDRPGMRALEELSVLSPLRMCDLTKDEIRELSRNANLFTWDKPAYACLATRIKPNEAITLDALNKVEKAEMFMMSLGFSSHRVRVSNNIATIIVKEEQKTLLEKHKGLIVDEFNQYFDKINL